MYSIGVYDPNELSKWYISALENSSHDNPEKGEGEGGQKILYSRLVLSLYHYPLWLEGWGEINNNVNML